jgi:hypothetical protein
MEKKSTTALRRRKKALLLRLPELTDVLRGSLIERYKSCGVPGCKCAKGPGHGPKHYLSVSRSGATPQMDYVPQDHVVQVKQYLENYRQVKQILGEVCAINRELLRRRVRL